MAQYGGVWSAPFDHQVNTAIATDPGIPFGGGLSAMTFYVHPLFGTLGWPAAAPPLPNPNDPTHPYTTGRRFNAIHMSLIPKGPNRGKVVVWNAGLCVGYATPWAPANTWWSFQPWAIVDPSPAPGAVQFQNFLLPIEAAPVNAQGVPLIAADLFCAGHAWTPYGDLVVIGGTRWNGGNASLPGAVTTFAFNPDLQTAGFPAPPPTLLPSLYPTSFGYWVGGPDMQLARWYPTATLTSRLNRVQTLYPTGGEVILCAGGSTQFPPIPNDPIWNNYEALVVVAGASQNGGSGLAADSTGPTSAPIYVWDGPGTTTPVPTPEIDWLLEYPRLHQLSNGRVFCSGYAQRGAMLDHETPGTWHKTAAQPPIDGTTTPPYSSNWGALRHDGSSVLLPNSNGVQDVVMRIGGGTDTPGPLVVESTTASTEVSVAGGTWSPTPAMPATDGAPDGGRMFTNVITLPTGALLVLGGQNIQPSQWPASATNMYSPLIYAGGAWHVDAPNPNTNPYPMPRPYHSTAVLLPDGRVLIGGGDDRLADYEIYSPYYLQLPANYRPTGVAFQVPGPVLNATYNAYELNYGQSYGMIYNIAADGGSVAKVVLSAPGSMTHHSDMHARHIELATVVQNSNQLTIKAPANSRVAPRGIYMLWIVAATGAISDVIWVVLP